MTSGCPITRRRANAAAGVAQVVLPSDLTSAVIGDTARGVIADERSRQRALSVRDEIATMPTATELIPDLERLPSRTR
jgi:hypothetical protein